MLLMKLYLNRILSKDAWSYAKKVDGGEEQPLIHVYECVLSADEFYSLKHILNANGVRWIAHCNGEEIDNG